MTDIFEYFSGVNTKMQGKIENKFTCSDKLKGEYSGLAQEHLTFWHQKHDRYFFTINTVKWQRKIY